MAIIICPVTVSPIPEADKAIDWKFSQVHKI